MTFQQSPSEHRPGRQRRPLADEVFLALVGEDAVVLDLRTDAYGCLAGLAPAVRLVDHQLEGETALLDDLGALGLLSAGAGRSRRAIPPHPTRELQPGPERRVGLDGLTFLRAARAARRLGAAAPVRAYLSSLPPPPGRPADPRRVAGLVASFRGLLPWTPGQGACLYRAFVLLGLLRRAGQDAVWVFGVRTWPFGAHCWLQIGDAVLDDDPERVSAYTPIMAA